VVEVLAHELADLVQLVRDRRQRGTQVSLGAPQLSTMSSRSFMPAAYAGRRDTGLRQRAGMASELLESCETAANRRAPPMAQRKPVTWCRGAPGKRRD